MTDSQFFSGQNFVEEYGLAKKTEYDPTLIASVSQEMTSSAFRIVHNIIPAKFKCV